jgi:hypothetical protein
MLFIALVANVYGILKLQARFYKALSERFASAFPSSEGLKH